MFIITKYDIQLQKRILGLIYNQASDSYNENSESVISQQVWLSTAVNA